MHAARPLMIALSAAALAATGCDSKISYEHATVHGKVTYNGKPVPMGQVMFLPVAAPEDGLLQPATGSIGADGTYALKSEADAGAVVGEHKVAVIAVDGGKPVEPTVEATSPAPAGGPGGRGKSPVFKTLVPKKYSDPATTPLTRKVNSGDNTIDLELTD